LGTFRLGNNTQQGIADYLTLPVWKLLFLLPQQQEKN